MGGEDDDMYRLSDGEIPQEGGEYSDISSDEDILDGEERINIEELPEVPTQLICKKFPGQQ